MGYLKTAGAPLSYEALQKIKAYIKKHGIIQFINLFKNFRTRNITGNDSFKWGDETEHHVIYWDHESSKAKILINAGDFQNLFNETQPEDGSHLQPEYGGWMLEGVPCKPFNSFDMHSLANLTVHYSKRRKSISIFLSKFGDYSISNISSYPLLGVGDYAIRIPSLTKSIESAKTLPKEELCNPGFISLYSLRRDNDPLPEEIKIESDEHLEVDRSENKYSESFFTFDAAINEHPRFPTLSKIIRERRGEKVCIKVPLFMDLKTSISMPTKFEPYPGYIYMDSMAFGMGSCCLQLTYQAHTIDHARFLHDQLLAIAPILSALSASAPIFKGKLSDIDLRFTVIAQSVDDRTLEERDPTNINYIPKSRYDHNSEYISTHESVMSHHNDTVPLQVDPEFIEMLKNAGVDDRLAYHIATLFVRDPLVVFEKGIELNDEETTAHFENLQSTNWNSIRFKPPPSLDSPIGWRVEFRPMDIQITDYENAALSALVSLLVKLLSTYNVNFIIPISMGDENMVRAHKRDAVLNERFYFRKNIVQSDYKSLDLEKTGYLKSSMKIHAEKEEVVEMTLAEILEGKADIEYKGILPLLIELINESEGDAKDKEQIKGYLNFLLKRAKGIYKTGAKYISDFVRVHNEYKFNSIVTEKINYELLRNLEEINEKNPIEG